MITLDLPTPFSTNASRRIDWASHKKRNDWIKLADALVLEKKQNRQNAIRGPFEAIITVTPSCRIDLDNCCKVLIDYAVRLKMVTDDGPDYLRKLTIEFGNVQNGSRLVLKPFIQKAPFVTGRERRRIIEYLFDHPEGVPVQRICEAIYSGDKGDHRTVWGILHHANKQLAPQGWRVRATGGPGSVYFLERIEKAAPGRAA